MTSGRGLLVFGTLAAIHALILFAGFFAPYDPAEQARVIPYAPPSRVHFVDVEGRLHWRPFVYAWTPDPAAYDRYLEDPSSRFPLQLFVRGAEYTVVPGIVTNVHLFGVEGPARVALLGTDGYGRDVLSRLLHGGRLSLVAGLLATVCSLLAAALIGTLAGFSGGAVDQVLMRVVDLFMAIPWLYLLFAVRAALPLQMDARDTFLLLVMVLGLIGWARPARLIRGIVLSARERTYVLAARGFGAPRRYLLRRHVLPQTAGVMLTQAALLVPHYVLAEVTLSFLGLGVGEPVPSWGNMLGALQQYHVLTSYWWMFAPAVALIAVTFGYHLLTSYVHERMRVVGI